jgi:hypothetical protein
MNAWAAAGGTAVVIPIVWAAAQVTPYGPVSLAAAGNSRQNVLTEINAAAAANLQVYVELSIQYPPAWATSSVPPFVNQAGSPYSSSKPGADIRDWIWSQTGREAVASFVAGAMSALRPSVAHIAGIRAGGGMFGELQYPYDGSTENGQSSFWGYGAAPQLGVNLAPNESRCPLPGYVYGHGNSASDARWAAWFFHSLASFATWYILQLRDNGWSGPVYVLHPSFGVRANWSADSAAYELELAHGTDFTIQMDAYSRLPNVWPWATWADDAEPYWGTPGATDSDEAAWRKLYELAAARGLARHMLGENTGGGGAGAIARMTRGPLAEGYNGLFYMNYRSLVANNLVTDLTSSFRTFA